MVPHRHCERSEAIQGRKHSTSAGIASSLALLAMTDNAI
jgi:hypothetical protein